MNKKDFYQLRKEIVLNSMFRNDYNTSFYIKASTIQSFFDSALDYYSDDGDYIIYRKKRIYLNDFLDIDF